MQLVVAERIDAIVEMNNPGVWILGASRDQDRNIGMGVVIEYENERGTPQWKNPPNTPWDYSLFGKAPAANPAPVEGSFELSFHMLPDEGKPFNKWVINDKSWPNVDPLMVKTGKRYRLTMHRGHEDSHPLHLHRHLFEIVKVGDNATSAFSRTRYACSVTT